MKREGWKGAKKSKRNYDAHARWKNAKKARNAERGPQIWFDRDELMAIGGPLAIKKGARGAVSSNLFR